MSETNTNSSDFKLIQRLIRQKQNIPKKIFCGDAIELKMHKSPMGLHSSSSSYMKCTKGPEMTTFKNSLATLINAQRS